MVKHSLGLGLSDNKHNELKQHSGLNRHTSKEIVELEKLQTAETVKRYKIQRVAEFVQSALIDKFTKNLNWVKRFKRPNKRKQWNSRKIGWIDLFCHWITLFLGLPLGFFVCLQLLTRILALFHVMQRFGYFLLPNYAFLNFFAPKTCSRLFAAKLGCCREDFTERNVFLFFFAKLHYF